MIRYALTCEEGHGFEAWFGSSDSFDEQAEAHAILCPACGSAEVKKAPMAPHVAKRRPEPPATLKRPSTRPSRSTATPAASAAAAPAVRSATT
jgi:hypothetical protein